MIREGRQAICCYLACAEFVCVEVFRFSKYLQPPCLRLDTLSASAWLNSTDAARNRTRISHQSSSIRDKVSTNNAKTPRFEYAHAPSCRKTSALPLRGISPICETQKRTVKCLHWSYITTLQLIYINLNSDKNHCIIWRTFPYGA